MTRDILAYMAFIFLEVSELFLDAGIALGQSGGDEKNVFYVASQYRADKANAMLEEFTRVLESIPASGPLAAVAQRDPINPPTKLCGYETFAEMLRDFITKSAVNGGDSRIGVQ